MSGPPLSGGVPIVTVAIRQKSGIHFFIFNMNSLFFLVLCVVVIFSSGFSIKNFKTYSFLKRMVATQIALLSCCSPVFANTAVGTRAPDFFLLSNADKPIGLKDLAAKRTAPYLCFVRTSLLFYIKLFLCCVLQSRRGSV